MSGNYSIQVAEEILKKLKENGWNAYLKPGMGDPAENIRRNLASSLQVGHKYVLLPDCSDPRNPTKVMAALETLAIKLSRQLPTLSVDGVQIPFLGFTLNQDCVRIHAPEGNVLKYPAFVDALASMVNARE